MKPTPYGYLGSDECVLRVVWSLGLVRAHHLVGLFGCSYESANRRLGPLVRSGALTRIRTARVTVYRIGPRVADAAPQFAGAWTPPMTTLAHTLLNADLVVAFVSRNLPAVTSWAGECELRTWTERGEAIPDASVYWEHSGRTGRLLLETDRGTEPQAVWRRKLLNYQGLADDELVVAAVPVPDRARRIAAAARELGVPLLAGLHGPLLGHRMPSVYDALAGVEAPLLRACLERPAQPVF